MNLIKAGGACFLAVSMVVDAHKHIEVAAYHGEPQPTNPFVQVSTATASAIFISERAWFSRFPE